MTDPSVYRTNAAPSHACPRCGGALDPAQLGSLPVSTCATCEGVFVGPEELGAMIVDVDTRAASLEALENVPIARESEVHYLACPTCGTRMNRHLYGRLSHVIVDACREHGVWFDRGELAAVLWFVEEGGLARAKKRLDEEKAEEARSARAAEIRMRISGGFSQAAALEAQARWHARGERAYAVKDALDALLSLLS